MLLAGDGVCAAGWGRSLCCWLGSGSVLLAGDGVCAAGWGRGLRADSEIGSAAAVAAVVSVAAVGGWFRFEFCSVYNTNVRRPVH